MLLSALLIRNPYVNDRLNNQHGQFLLMGNSGNNTESKLLVWPPNDFIEPIRRKVADNQI